MKTSEDIRPLLDIAKKNGYKVVPSGKHHKILDSKGRVVTDDKGPLIVSSTPGDFRARDMHVKRFIGAGVIKPEQDPWKPKKEMTEEEKGERKRSTMTEETKQRIREATHRKALVNRERSRKIRSRLEPIVVKLGGWDKKGLQANFGLTYWHLMNTLNRVGRPPTAGAAVQQVYKLRKGETLSESSAELFELYLTDLETSGDPGARFFELQREAKGVQPVKPPAIQIPQRTNGDEPVAALVAAPEPAPVVAPRHPAQARIPTMALRAAAMMARSPDNTIDEIEAVVQKLAMYEMQATEGE